MKRKLILKKNKEEDYDFDFSLYERQEQESEQIKSIFKDNKPRVLNFRSKFSPSASMLDLVLIPLRQKIGEYGIKVASFSQNINDLKTFYGCCNEFWATIKDIFGSVINKEMKKIEKKCIEKLKEASEGENIDEKTHLWLLYYRDKVYMIAQRNNLGLEVEKSSFSHFNKAKKGMIE